MIERLFCTFGTLLNLKIYLLRSMIIDSLGSDSSSERSPQSRYLFSRCWPSKYISFVSFSFSVSRKTPTALLLSFLLVSFRKWEILNRIPLGYLNDYKSWQEWKFWRLLGCVPFLERGALSQTRFETTRFVQLARYGLATPVISLLTSSDHRLVCHSLFSNQVQEIWVRLILWS